MKVLCLSITICCALFVSVVYSAECFNESNCCRGRPPGTVMGNPYNFNKFYRCNVSIAYSYECVMADKPCFNNGTDLCDTMLNVPHCANGGVTTTTTRPTTVLPVDGDCRPHPAVHNIAIPGDCSKYMLCVSGTVRPGEHQCPEMFDPFEEHCNFESEVQCTVPICDRAAPTINIPHTMNCSRHWTCTMGTGALTLVNCPPGQKFDVDILDCVPEAEAKCTVVNVCPDDEGISYEPHEDCSKYWVCADGTGYEFECATGWKYDCLEEVCTPDGNPFCGCLSKSGMIQNFWDTY